MFFSGIIMSTLYTVIFQGFSHLGHAWNLRTTAGPCRWTDRGLGWCRLRGRWRTGWCNRRWCWRRRRGRGTAFDVFFWGYFLGRDFGCCYFDRHMFFVFYRRGPVLQPRYFVSLTWAVGLNPFRNHSCKKSFIFKKTCFKCLENWNSDIFPVNFEELEEDAIQEDENNQAEVAVPEKSEQNDSAEGTEVDDDDKLGEDCIKLLSSAEAEKPYQNYMKNAKGEEPHLAMPCHQKVSGSIYYLPRQLSRHIFVSSLQWWINEFI